MQRETAEQRWAAIARGPDTNIDVAEAALLIALDEYPALNVAAYRARIDDMAVTLKRRLRADISTGDSILALNRYLFEELGFSGNGADFYDPRNSYLNDVLDRRLGIPITLSLVYIEIGRRCGLALHGVSFPAHFLVKCVVRDGAIVLDPYGKGACLGMEELQQRLHAVSPGAAPQADAVKSLLATAGPRDILIRILRNLKGIHLNKPDPLKALAVANRILDLAPDAAAEHADRGQIYLELECFRAALADFEESLRLAPKADGADAIRSRIAEILPLAARLN